MNEIKSICSALLMILLIGFKKCAMKNALNTLTEVVAFRLTNGNIDDRKPVSEMLRGMKRKAFANRGYLSEKLTSELMKNGTSLFTKVKKNIKNKLRTLIDKLMLKKRAIIESVNNLLKNSCQMERHRHRS